MCLLNNLFKYCVSFLKEGVLFKKHCVQIHIYRCEYEKGSVFLGMGACKCGCGGFPCSLSVHNCKYRLMHARTHNHTLSPHPQIIGINSLRFRRFISKARLSWSCRRRGCLSHSTRRRQSKAFVTIRDICPYLVLCILDVKHVLFWLYGLYCFRLLGLDAVSLSLVLKEWIFLQLQVLLANFSTFPTPPKFCLNDFYMSLVLSPVLRWYRWCHLYACLLFWLCLKTFEYLSVLACCTFCVSRLGTIFGKSMFQKGNAATNTKEDFWKGTFEKRAGWPFRDRGNLMAIKKTFCCA